MRRCVISRRPLWPSSGPEVRVLFEEIASMLNRPPARRLKLPPLRSLLLLAGALVLSPSLSSGQEAPVAVIDVPFLAQTPELCGGAAAAMVLRYWGVPDVQAEDFSSLVDRSRGGIATGALSASFVERGFEATSIRAESVDIEGEIRRGRPVIALVDGGGGRLHYVVIVAWASGRVLFHDPATGPFRLKSEAEFRRLWKASQDWALVAAPGTGLHLRPDARDAPAVAPTHPRPCDALVEPAIAVARGGEPEGAVPALTAAMEICPLEPRPLTALAGVRFRQGRFKEAAGLARLALERAPGDLDTWRLLATSLYLAEEREHALAAWNRLDEPRIDRVQIEGLIRTRQDTATAFLGLTPRDILTPQSLSLAARRVEQLPTSSGGRVTYRPGAEGRADVIASVGEGGLFEPWRILVLRLGIEAASKRETSLQIRSPTGRGEKVEIGGRFAAHRPSFRASIDTPRFAGLPGVVTVAGLWDRQTYRLGAASDAVALIETRGRGAVDWSDWRSAVMRLELGAAIDRFHLSDDRKTFISVRAAFEARRAADRLSLLVDGTSWRSLGEGRSFEEFGAAGVFRSRVRSRGFVVNARFDARRATTAAPLAIWPGAGTGPGRPLLLRASKLIRGGELTGEVLGRGLLHGTVEVEIPVADRGAARLGLAAFTDWARPWDTRARVGPGSNVFALGLGVRLRAPGGAAFRVDVAKRPGRAGLVYSAGVIPVWPR